MADLSPNPNKNSIDAVMRMQQYIAEHIKEPITQHQLAQAACTDGLPRLYRRQAGKGS